MHELAITEGILRIAQKEIEKYNVKKVINIKIKIGELSGVMPQLIQEYFNIVSKDTIATGAELIIEKVPISVKCLECNNESKIDKMMFKCPACNSINIKLLTGKEFYVDSLEVE
jgi:hydrogenase nickel incorporation protein HypA/HybF